MYDNPQIVVYPPTLNKDQRILDNDDELSLSPETLERNFWASPVDPFQPALLHLPQDSYHSSDYFYETNFRLVLDPSTSPISVRANSDHSHNIDTGTTSWSASTTEGQFVFHESSIPNEFAVLQSNGMYKSDLVMEHYPAFTMPSMLQIAAETSCDQSSISSFTSPISPEESNYSLGSALEPPQRTDSQSASHMCYTLWKQIPEDAIIITGSRNFVPQKLYKPFTEADKERYLERVSLSPSIIFVTKEPLEWGISLESALKGKTQNLVDKDDPVLQDCGPSVTIRINWPGYAPFKRQISSRNWRKTKGPITKGKLAQSIAKTTSQFIEKASNRQLEFGAEKTWKVGKQHIKVEDLILVSLHHVSQGSWQPHFRLWRDIV